MLVAGIGNIFFGDDAFGVHVIRYLADHPLPNGVRVVDFGIRGIDLGYALLDPWDGVILVDATQQGGQPGTLYVIEPDLGPSADFELEQITVQAHDAQALSVLRWARAQGGCFPWLRLVGCEPTHCEGYNGELLGDLTPAVAAAVTPAANLVHSLIRECRERAHA
jgi:hydrogenase maturation protease